MSKTQGLYGGISLAGSIIGYDSGTAQSYYGTPVGARQTVLDMTVSNPGANPLRAMLAKYGG